MATASCPIVVRELFRRRRLTREITAIEKETDRSLQREHSIYEGMEIRVESGKKIEPLKEELDRLSTRRLVKKADRLGVDIPKNCWHYVEDPLFPGFAPLDWYLQETGRRTVAKLIRKERREAIEWWVKVLTPILTLIVGILSLIVTGLTVWFAWPKD